VYDDILIRKDQYSSSDNSISHSSVGYETQKDTKTQ